MTYYTYIESPLTTLLLTSDGVSLTRLYMNTPDPEVIGNWVRDDGAVPFAAAKVQLSAYFAGTLTEFDVPLSPVGTLFQRQVWGELMRIPYGSTTSYGEVARLIGNPNGSRAVGMANGSNPISIIVPCHRVIGASGKLVGYSGGLSRKQSLLAFETAVASNGPQSFEASQTSALTLPL